LFLREGLQPRVERFVDSLLQIWVESLAKLLLDPTLDRWIMEFSILWDQSWPPGLIGIPSPTEAENDPKVSWILTLTLTAFPSEAALEMLGQSVSEAVHPHQSEHGFH